MSKKCKYCNKQIQDRSPGPHYAHNLECYEKYKCEKEIELNSLKEANALIKCKICGFEGKALTRHITDKHNISVKEYNKKFNIKRKSYKICEFCGSRESLSINIIKIVQSVFKLIRTS